MARCLILPFPTGLRLSMYEWANKHQPWKFQKDHKQIIVWCSVCKDSCHLSSNPPVSINPVVNHRWAKRYSRHPRRPEGLICSWPWTLVVSLGIFDTPASTASRSHHPGSWFSLSGLPIAAHGMGSLYLFSPEKSTRKGADLQVKCEWSFSSQHLLQGT